MGVVNVTPDSFSDGGRHSRTEAAVEESLRLVAEGADILDIGGESTRPGAVPVDEAEELRRVLPVIEAVVPRIRVPVSIDTMKPGVALAALKAGASLVNDVAASREDETLWRVVSQFGAAYVAMHMRGTPATMQVDPVYGDAVGEVDAFFGERLRRLGACGVEAGQVILDPGIGFGKTPGHNLDLLRHLARFHHWGRPLLVGLSRKSLVAQVTGASNVAERLPGSLAGAVWARMQGVQLVRTHDVAETRRALAMADAIGGQETECTG
jgi:dihydropteroate synthase